jgi:nucleotide-binding universal stress UspA family protein
MNIVVASDLSGRSDRALGRGFALARELGGALTVVHVVAPDLPDDLRAHCVDWAKRRFARELEERTASTGVQASSRIHAGDPKVAINAAADAANAGLLVLGFHDRSRPESRFAETTAGRVLKGSQRPILLVREEPAGAYARVVIGVDFSWFSRVAIRHAFRFAPGARFHLLHAYHVPYQGFLGSARFSEQVAYERRLELDDFLAGEMRLLTRRAAELGVRPEALETVLREGPARDVLLEEAARRDADLLVIGTHGKTGVARAMFGSVAADVLSAPPCDVLVSPP